MTRSKPVVCTAIEAPQVGPHLETLERLRKAVGSVDRSDGWQSWPGSPRHRQPPTMLDRFVARGGAVLRSSDARVRPIGRETGVEQIVLALGTDRPRAQPFMESEARQSPGRVRLLADGSVPCRATGGLVPSLGRGRGAS